MTILNQRWAGATSSADRPDQADRRLSPRLRRLVLTIHLIVSVGWIGIEAGLLALGLTGLLTDDPAVLRAAYVALGLFGAIFYVPVSLAALLTGLLLAFGTRWRLLRHSWVLVKFIMTAALTVGGSLVVNERLQEAAHRAAGVQARPVTGADIGDVRFTIVSATSVGLLMLIAATVLSVYKPWGKTWFARRANVRGQVAADRVDPSRISA